MMEFNFASIGNPFQPLQSAEQCQWGALGYFGGYGAQIRKIVVPVKESACMICTQFVAELTCGLRI